jgi:threonine/homoserine/homoserine lactone efflux protein
VLEVLLAFAPVAAVLCLTPGPATALVVGTALRGGRRHALLTCADNSVGIVAVSRAA